ncbi:MFS transporter [Candidatus Micrarchaeota archaeon]|nr:MFS transporter [Candidatus Micrarchaeota archaeon]
MKVPKNILVLSVVSFINDLSSKIILPLMPFFILSLGGTGLAVGLISGLSESIVSFMKIGSGYLSDKIKNKRFLVALGYFVSALSKLLFAFAFIWQHVLIFRSGERMGKGIRSAPVDVLISNSSEKGRKGTGFGFHRAFDSAGAVIGSLIALLLFFYFHLSFQQIFLFAGIIAFFSIIPIFLVKESDAPPKKISFKQGISSLSSPLKLLIFSSAVFAFGNFGYMFFVLRSQQAFSLGLAVAMPIVLYTVFQLSSALISFPAGKLSDRTGQKKILLFSYILYILTNIGFVYLKSFPALILLFIVFGIVYSLSDSMQRTFVSNISSEEFKGTSLGSYHAAVALTALPGGLTAGFLWDFSQEYTFYFGAITTVIAFVLLLLVKED